MDRPAARASRSRSATSTRTSPRRPPQVVEPGQMLAVMGTSTCHVVNGDALAEVPGHVRRRRAAASCPGCGATRRARAASATSSPGSSTTPCRRATTTRRAPAALDLHAHLSELAARRRSARTGSIALDWNNGNRSVLVDHELSGLIVGLTLATRAEDIYRALIEATAFGTRTIVEAFADGGHPRATSSSSPAAWSRTRWSCRSTPTCTRMPLHVIASEQGTALGSAMHAAVAAGLHPDIHAAAAAMGRVVRDAYVPDAARADAYDVAVRALRAPARPLRPRRRRRDARAARPAPAGGSRMADARRAPARGLRAARRAVAQRARRVDERERLRARARRGADGHQGQRRPVRRADAGRDRRLRPLRRRSSRATLAPSSDAATHGYVYRHMPEVGGVAHTHSPYATAWATRGEPIPCVLTAMADEFGGEIPVGAVRADRRRGDRPRRSSRRSTGTARRRCSCAATACSRSAPARATRSRPRSCARTWRARSTSRASLGAVEPLDPASIDALYDRYQNVYGQR